jgi:hypothetical protein
MLSVRERPKRINRLVRRHNANGLKPDFSLKQKPIAHGCRIPLIKHEKSSAGTGRGCPAFDESNSVWHAIAIRPEKKVCRWIKELSG